jgi:SAM-dependent methyltransferase
MRQRLWKTPFTQSATVNYWDDIYDKPDFYGDVFRRRLDLVLAGLDELQLPGTARILDVGAGTGRLVQRLISQGYAALGMDYSFEMLVKASERIRPGDGGGSPLLQADVASLPFEAGSFDVVVCIGVIPHLPAYDAALQELGRLLKPGGTLLLTFDNKAGLIKRLDLARLLQRVFGKATGKYAVDKYRGARTHFLPGIRRSLAGAHIQVTDCWPVTLDLFSFFGREVLPRRMSIPLTRFFDRFSNVPVVGSFGGMCVLKALKSI